MEIFLTTSLQRKGPVLKFLISLGSSKYDVIVASRLLSKTTVHYSRLDITIFL